MSATRRYFGEWTTSECRGDQHDDLHFSRSLHARGHQGDVCEAGGPFRGGPELFAAAGGRLISWYLTLGPYDWLIIAEAPDEPTMISAVLAAAAGGSLSDITTTVALTASDTTKAFQRAGELTLKFRSAGRADYYGVEINSRREIGEA